MADPIQDEPLPIAIRATIIMVSRNRAIELESALDAIQLTTNRPELEVIVMDNGSTDSTTSLRDKYGEAITFLKLPKNFGWVRAVNIALRSAQGEYVLFADPAVRFDKDAPAKLIRVLDSSPEATAAVPALRTESGEPIAQTRDLPEPGNLKPALRKPNTSETALAFPSFQAFMVRKTFLKGMNFLDQRFGDSWGDAEICFQIRNAGKKILLVPDALATAGNGHPPLEEASLVEADFVQGAATYLGKHWGFLKALLYRVGCIFAALFTFKLGLFFDLINGQKIDGTHA